MGLIVWEGLSAFEHAQCTLLARGLPLVKSLLPCSLSPLTLPWLTVLLCSIFFFLVRLIQSVDASKAFSSGPHSGLYFSLSRACCSGCPASPHWCHVIVLGFPVLPLVFVGVEEAVAELWSFRLCCGLNVPHHRRMSVPSRDGVLAWIRDKLQALQSQLIPESPPLPVPSVTGGPQSGLSLLLGSMLLASSIVSVPSVGHLHQPGPGRATSWALHTSGPLPSWGESPLRTLAQPPNSTSIRADFVPI